MKIFVTLNKDGEPAGYYHEAVHGPVRLMVPDPDWVRPQKDGVDDPEAVAPLVDAGPNPDSKIPPGAVEIDEAQYAELLANPGLRGASVDAGGKVLLHEIAPPPPTLAQIKRRFTSRIQSRLDNWAQDHGYDGILSAATYAASSVPKFAAEGQAAVAARDATWAMAAAITADVESGKRPVPTTEELDAELPPLVWPKWPQ